MSNASKAIQNLVIKFVDELHDLFLADLLSAIAEHTGSKRSAAKLVDKSGHRPKGQKRPPEELEALTKKLHAYVSKNPGQRIEQIGAGMGTATKDLNLPVKKLIADRRLTTKGQKRATTYSAR